MAYFFIGFWLIKISRLENAVLSKTTERFYEILRQITNPMHDMEKLANTKLEYNFSLSLLYTVGYRYT